MCTGLTRKEVDSVDLKRVMYIEIVMTLKTTVLS